MSAQLGEWFCNRDVQPKVRGEEAGTPSTSFVADRFLELHIFFLFFFLEIHSSFFAGRHGRQENSHQDWGQSGLASLMPFTSFCSVSSVYPRSACNCIALWLIFHTFGLESTSLHQGANRPSVLLQPITWQQVSCVISCTRHSWCARNSGSSFGPASRRRMLRTCRWSSNS